MRWLLTICLALAILVGSAPAADVTFEPLPGSQTGLRQAMETWYQLEMERQGGPGKESHGWWPWGIRVADFDRDGAFDILASHHGVPRSIILRSHFADRGKLEFSNVTSTLGLDSRDLPGADDRPWIWDFDGDGWLDIAGLSDESRPPSAWNERGQQFVSTGKPLFGSLAHPKEVLDLDGDGWLDIDAGAKGRWIFVPANRDFRHESTRRFPPPDDLDSALASELEAVRVKHRFFQLEYWTHAPLGYDTLGYDPRPIDLDGDGRGELVIHGSGGYGAAYLGRYLSRNASGALVDRTTERGLPQQGAPILIDDLTGDGRPEILIAGERDSGLYVNDGHGQFTRRPGPLTDFLVRRGPYLLRAYRTDFDNDGRPDLLLSNPRLGLAAVFQNSGEGEFRSILSLSGCWDSNPLAIVDLDDDGRLDLVVGGSTGPESKRDITLYRNQTPSAGRYLKIEPAMSTPNPYAVGAVLEVFAPGGLDASGARPLWVEKAHIDGTPVHVGLGERTTCDVRITFPNRQIVEQRAVAVDQTIKIPAP